MSDLIRRAGLGTLAGGAMIALLGGCGGGAQSASSVVSSDGYTVAAGSGASGAMPSGAQSYVKTVAAGYKGGTSADPAHIELVYVTTSPTEAQVLANAVSVAGFNDQPGHLVSVTTQGSVVRVRGDKTAITAWEQDLP